MNQFWMFLSLPKPVISFSQASKHLWDFVCMILQFLCFTIIVDYSEEKSPWSIQSSSLLNCRPVSFSSAQQSAPILFRFPESSLPAIRLNFILAIGALKHRLNCVGSRPGPTPSHLGLKLNWKKKKSCIIKSFVNALTSTTTEAPVGLTDNELVEKKVWWKCISMPNATENSPQWSERA